MVGLFALLLLSTGFAQQSEEIPFDVKYATAVAAIEIMHTPDPSLATVSVQASKALGSDAFPYTGFALGAVMLKKYEQGTADENRRELTSVLQFVDKFRRTTLQFVVLDYHIEENNLSVTKADRWLIAPTDPYIETLFVPTKKIIQAGQGIYDNWETLYEFVSTNAIEVKRTEKGSFYGFIFCMDRTASDAKFYTVVSRNKREKRKDKSIAKGVVFDYSGWKVSIVAGKFQLGNPAKKFYINTFYNPGSGTPEKFRETKRIAQFNSGDLSLVQTAPPRQSAPVKAMATQKVVSQPEFIPIPVPAQKQAAPTPVPVQVVQAPAPTQVAPAPAPTTNTEGSLARGLAFLNPVFPEDVALIQERLKALGYYRGLIDQNFGPQTKHALDSFAVKHGHQKGQWSLGLQKALFAGSRL